MTFRHGLLIGLALGVLFMISADYVLEQVAAHKYCVEKGFHTGRATGKWGDALCWNEVRP